MSNVRLTARRISGLVAVLVAVAGALGGCDSGSEDERSAPAASGGTTVERSSEAYATCVVDGGGQVPAGADVADPAAPLEFPGLSIEEINQVLAACADLRPERVEVTDAEVRETYDRWLGQADCLRELGYEPDPAPSFDTFLAGWRGEGPWTPIDGVDTSAWTAADAQAAKDACVLEFFDFG